MLSNNHSWKKLSQAVSSILRHEPRQYGLSLDKEGWVSIDELLLALKASNQKWSTITESDLHEMIQKSDKKRHEIQAGKIRALYGHSLQDKIIKQSKKPPEYLYHGTSPEVMEQMKAKGLLPMKRQYVHLSTDIETAKQVGKRKTSNPIILQIKAQEAYCAGIPFYVGNDLVWLADWIPKKFIVLEDNN
jgi:putative RNA 2'-phosphotransferase